MFFQNSRLSLLLPVGARRWIALMLGLICGVERLESAALDYQVRLQTVMEHDDGHFLWYHPRVAAFSGVNATGVVMTLQKHLKISDYYSGLHVMWRDSLQGAWRGPVAVPELDWQPQAEGIT